VLQEARGEGGGTIPPHMCSYLKEMHGWKSNGRFTLSEKTQVERVEWIPSNQVPLLPTFLPPPQWMMTKRVPRHPGLCRREGRNKGRGGLLVREDVKRAGAARRRHMARHWQVRSYSRDLSSVPWLMDERTLERWMPKRNRC
jgi:hypothetical protein